MAKRGIKIKKTRTGGQKAVDGAPDRVFRDGGKVGGGQREGREVGMGGLLFLACLGICPGVKMCTHRGCPWARGCQH